MTKRGFTLIELLVVMAIIAILAAILFPVFAQAKNAAKGAVCISNMKQMATASILYEGDYDDYWCPLARYEPLPGFADQIFWIGYDNNNAPVNNGYWGKVNQAKVNAIRPGMLDPYLKNDDVKKCPNKPGRSQSVLAGNGFSPLHTSSAYYVTHPGASGQEYGPGAKSQVLINGTFSFSAASESEIEETAATLAAWEHDFDVPLCNFLQPYNWETGPPDTQALKDHFNLLHTNGTNTFWCDGHAKRVNYGALKRRWFSVRKDVYG